MPANSPKYDITTYKISYSTDYQDKKYGVNETIKDLLADIYPDIEKGKQSTIKKLHRLCKKYHRVPHFKNYLSSAYANAGLEKQARKINEWILEKHPDYLFGKINRANFLIFNGEAEKIPEVLGKEMELGALYPDRDEFHIDEVLSFYLAALRYYVEIGDMESAQIRYKLLSELDPDSPETAFATAEMMRLLMKTSPELTRWREFKAIERSVNPSGYRTETQTNKKPSFFHREIDQLYLHGFDIDPEIIRTILNLPRESLIQDLEAVLEDAINRYESIRKEVSVHGWHDEKYAFSIHALMILAELESEESLPVVLDLLRQGEELLDFYYGDGMEEFFSEPVAAIAKNRLDDLRSFVMEPGRWTYSRNIGITAAELIGRFDPGKRKQVIELFKEWIEFHLNQTDNDEVIDTTLISFMVWSCINLKATKLLLLIRSLYDNKLVHEEITGTFEDVKRDMRLNDNLQREKPETIWQKYDKLKQSYINDFGHTDSEFETNPLPASQPNIEPYHMPEPAENIFKDVGRNDPCPCGSGRKFKKCCM